MTFNWVLGEARIIDIRLLIIQNASTESISTKFKYPNNKQISNSNKQ